MDIGKVENLILKLLRDYLASEGSKVAVDRNSVLLGQGAVLDSLGLVNLVVDLEGALAEQGHQVTLATEDAMTREVSPFGSVAKFAAYAHELMVGSSGRS